MDTDQITISYAGTLGFSDSMQARLTSSFLERAFWTYKHNQAYAQTRSCLPLFQAVASIKKSVRISLRVRLWGSIHEKNIQLAQAMGISENVQIEGRKSKEETRRLLSNSDILYLPIERNTPNHETLFIPGKLYEYLSLKKPVICFSDGCDATRILERAGVGEIYGYDEIHACAQFIENRLLGETLSRHEHINESYIKTFKYEKKAKILSEIIQSTTK